MQSIQFYSAMSWIFEITVFKEKYPPERKKIDVPEVLNDRVNENNKKIYFFSEEFFFKQWKFNFWERKCDFLKYFFKF